MTWAAVFVAAALFLLIWKAGRMVWKVRYRPRGTVIYEGAPDIVVPTITLSPLTAISLRVGTAFSRTFSASGGTAPYTFTVASGTLPAGLSLSGGVLSGTPTTEAAFSFGIKATDVLGYASAVGVFSGTVQAAVVPPDTTPDPFTFTDVTNATPGAPQTSNTITVSGINAPATMAVTGGVYYKNGGSASAVSTTVVAGDTVSVGHTASSSNSTAVNTTLTIGGVSDTFTSTTVAAASTFPSTVNASLPVPTLTLNTGQTTYPPAFLIGNLGDALVGDTLWIEQRNNLTATLIARFSKTITLSEAEAEEADFGLDAITTGTFDYLPVLQRGTERSDYGAAVNHGPDNVAPTLGVNAPTSVTHQAATLQFTLDEPATVFWVVTTSATKPTTTQIDAGQSHTGAAAAAFGSEAAAVAGNVTDSASGLAATTGYYVHAYAKDAANNPTAVGTSPLFTTLAMPSVAFADAPVSNSGMVLTGSPKRTAHPTDSAGPQVAFLNKSIAPTGTATLTFTIDALTSSGDALMVGFAFDAMANNPFYGAYGDTASFGISFGTWGWEIRKGGAVQATDYGDPMAVGDQIKLALTAGSLQVQRIRGGTTTDKGPAITAPSGTGNITPFFFGSNNTATVTVNPGTL